MLSLSKISILGCGWLGRPLARRCTQNGLIVHGATTTRSKMDDLERDGIRPFFMSADPDLKGERLSEFFETDALVLTLPFRRSFRDPSEYLRQIRSVDSFLSRSPIRFCVFTGSTSVYPPDAPMAKEDMAFVPYNERSAVLREAEEFLMSRKTYQTTVLRLAGLYGGSRRIGQFLAGRQQLERPGVPVNLVHQEDCVEILWQVLAKGVRGEILNVCSDEHPTRKDLYTLAARQQGLEEPVFAESASRAAAGKIVDNRKIKERLGYVFRHPDPLSDVLRGVSDAKTSSR